MRQTLILVAIITARVAQGAALQPEPAIQSSIEKVANALNQDDIEARREIRNLKDSVANKSDIVNQLIVYAGGPGEERPLTALAILQLLDLPPKVVIPELAPHLNDEDRKVRSFVRDWFQGHDNAGPDETKLKPVNYADYADYVRKLGQNVPTAFAQYIFERSPDRAFLVFARAQPKSKAVKGLEAIRQKMEEQRPGSLDGFPPARAGIEDNDLLLAEHMISSAIWLRSHYFHEKFPEALPEAEQQLTKLSEREQWWARLYVAEIMKRNQELRQADVLEKLSNDSNELVSQTAKSAID